MGDEITMTADQLLLLIGSKEAKIYHLTLALNAAKQALQVVDAEVKRLREEAAKSTS